MVDLMRKWLAKFDEHINSLAWPEDCLLQHSRRTRRLTLVCYDQHFIFSIRACSCGVLILFFAATNLWIAITVELRLVLIFSCEATFEKEQVRVAAGANSIPSMLSILRILRSHRSWIRLQQRLQLQIHQPSFSSGSWVLGIGMLVLCQAKRFNGEHFSSFCYLLTSGSLDSSVAFGSQQRF